MKKLLLIVTVVLAFGSVRSQNIFSYGFSGVTADLDTAGWIRTNQSTLPDPARLWSIANYAAGVYNPPTSAGTPFQTTTFTAGQATPIPNGQDGAPNSFAVVNFLSTTSTAATGATISNWLISPVVTIQNGDVVSFYTRIGKYSATNMAAFADDLQLRMSTNGDFSLTPSTGPADFGDYTNLLVDINPAFNLTSYPASGWTQFSYTVTGLTGPTDAKFAFRYYVTDGGLNGTKSDLIGIDTFSVDRPLAATNEFFTSNFSVYPNPATSVINIEGKNNISISEIKLTDINGRTVKSLKGNAATSQINIADINSGVYFLSISSDKGTGTTKIVKN